MLEVKTILQNNSMYNIHCLYALNSRFKYIYDLVYFYLFFCKFFLTF